jgi:hypothetical protein
MRKKTKKAWNENKSLINFGVSPSGPGAESILICLIASVSSSLEKAPQRVESDSDRGPSREVKEGKIVADASALGDITCSKCSTKVDGGIGTEERLEDIEEKIFHARE